MFTKLKEGTRVRLDGSKLIADDGTVLAEGAAQDRESIARAMTDAKAGLSTQLEAFAANTMEYMKRERALLQGRKPEARAFAERAERGLPAGSAGSLRAQDIRRAAEKQKN